MGRKKKTTTVTQEKDKQGNNNKLTQNSGMVYQGTVTIKTIKNNKIIKTIRTHNNGTLNLFNFLTNCLLETYEPTGVPKFIKLFYGTTGNKTPETATLLTSQMQPRVSKNIIIDSSNTTSSAVLTFLVPRTSINSEGANKCNIIALYNTKNSSQEKSGYSAFVVLKDEIDLSKIDVGTNLLITWTLKLSNI